MDVELLVNGSFEEPPTVGVVARPNGTVPGWFSEGSILEMWGPGSVIPDHPIDGGQKIEVDSTSQPYQDVAVPAQERTLRWRFSHRTRPGHGSIIRLRLGPTSAGSNTNPIVFTSTVEDDGMWHDRTGEWVKPAGVTSVRFEIDNVSPAGANNAGLDYTSLLLLAEREPVPCGCCPVPLGGCYAAPVTAQFARDLGPDGRVLADNVATFADFAGSGIDVTVSLSGGETLTASAAPLGLTVGIAPPAAVVVSIGFSAPVLLRSFDINDLDAPTRLEQLFDFSTPFSGVSGPLSIGPCTGSGAPGPQPAGCIGATSNNSTGRVLFPGPSVSLLQFTIGRPNALGQFLTGLAFDTVTPEYLPAFAFRCPDDPSAVRWFNTDSDEVPAGDVVPCPPAGV